MRIGALFRKSASILGLVEQAFWRMPLFTEWFGASSLEVILARQSSHLPTWASASRTSGSRRIFHSAAWKISEKDSAVSILHAYSYRVGNCNCLLSNTDRWLSIANNLLDFFVHAVLPSDSWPWRLFHNFRFWPQNSSVANSARYFFLPLSSICENQVLLSSDEYLHVVQFRIEFLNIIISKNNCK